MSLGDLETLTRTLWAEARGDGSAGMIAVGCVIRNRVLKHWNGAKNYEDVCRAPNQFSCWNANDPQSKILLSQTGPVDYMSQVAHKIATDFLANMPDIRFDVTNGATSYYSPEAMIPANRVPNWAAGKQPVAIIGRHRFFAV